MFLTYVIFGQLDTLKKSFTFRQKHFSGIIQRRFYGKIFWCIQGMSQALVTKETKMAIPKLFALNATQK